MFSINQVFNSFPSICKTLVLSTVLLENWRHVDFLNGMASDKTKCLGGELPVKRLANIVGVEGKQNDVIVCPSEVTRQEKQHVIFFGGDIQVCITHSSNFLV